MSAPYYFQTFKKRDLYVQNYVRAKLDSNGVPLEFDTDQKPIFSFFPAACGRLDFTTVNSFLPIRQYNAPTTTYIAPTAYPLSFIYSFHPGDPVVITNGNVMSAATITDVGFNIVADIDTYDKNTQVFTFTETTSGVLSAIGTGENFALRFTKHPQTIYSIIVKKRDTTNGSITATEDFIGEDIGPESHSGFDISTFQVDQDLWGYSYTSTDPLTSRAFTSSLTAGFENYGIKAPNKSPFISSKWDVSDGYENLTQPAKRNKLYITAYNSSTKTYTLSSGYPFTVENSYDNLFFYPGLLTTVYHNNRQKQIIIGGIDITNKTFYASTEVWGSSYTVPASATWRNYVLDKTISVADPTGGDWHIFKNNPMQALSLSATYCETVNRCLCALSAQLTRDTGALSGYSKPFNLITDAKSYRLRYITPPSGGKPERWINGKKTIFAEYITNIATLTSTVINTTNTTLADGYNVSIAKNNNTYIVCTGQTKTQEITTYPMTYNVYDTNNQSILNTQLLPLTTNYLGTNSWSVGPVSNWNELSSFTFASVSACGVSDLNGILSLSDQILNNKPVYVKRYTNAYLCFENDSWVFKNFGDEILYYAPEPNLTYPWQSNGWVISGGAILTAAGYDTIEGFYGQSNIPVLQNGTNGTIDISNIGEVTVSNPGNNYTDGIAIIGGGTRIIISVSSGGVSPAPIVTAKTSTFGSKIYQTTNATYVLDAGQGMVYSYAYDVATSSFKYAFFYLPEFYYNNQPNPYVEFYDICAAASSHGDGTDYVAISLKYRDSIDPNLWYYGIQVFISDPYKTYNHPYTNGTRIFSLDSTQIPHLTSQAETNRDTAMFISTNGYASNNGKHNLAILYVARANNTYYNGCTGVIDVIGLNGYINSTHIGSIYLNNSYFNTKNPTLTSYRLGTAITANKNSLFYTLSSTTSNTENIVEYCTVRGDTLNNQYDLTPSFYLSSAENNFGKYLNAYDTLYNIPYRDLSLGYVTDTNRLYIGDNNNLNIYEKYFSSYLPLTAITVEHTDCIAYYTDFIGHSGNRINFYTISAVC